MESNTFSEPGPSGDLNEDIKVDKAPIGDRVESPKADEDDIEGAIEKVSEAQPPKGNVEVKEETIPFLNKGKKVTLKSFSDLANLDGVKEIRQKDASNFVRESGKITKAGYSNFGFILDSKTGDELWFRS